MTRGRTEPTLRPAAAARQALEAVIARHAEAGALLEAARGTLDRATQADRLKEAATALRSAGQRASKAATLYAQWREW